jgi:catechol 2,3-dioxygenase-like lactoylglutathione lyase family enzyme
MLGMAVERMDHVGIIVGDLEASIDFFQALGLELDGRASVGGSWVDRVIGLDGAQSDIAMLRTPDGHNQIELVQFHSPEIEHEPADAPANLSGLRHLTFAVDDLDATLDRLRGHGAELVGEVVAYEDVYRLCYLRGPEGIILELAERITG